jgi:gas vesicle protein
MSENIDSKAAYFLVGLGIGSLICVLFAPKSGKETRDYLTLKAKEGSDYVRRQAQEMKEQAEDLVERGTQVVARKQEELATALDTGREAYQREKTKAQVA